MRRKNSGSTLLMVLLVLAIGTTILVTALSSSRSYRRIAGIRTGSEKLRQTAETCANLGVNTARSYKVGLYPYVTPHSNLSGLVATSVNGQLIGDMTCDTSWTDNNDDADQNTDADGTIYVASTISNSKTGYRAYLNMLINISSAGWVETYAISDH